MLLPWKLPCDFFDSILWFEDQYAEFTPKFLLMREEMRITSDKYVAFVHYVTENMIDILSLRSFHNLTKIINHFSVVFRNEIVSGVEARHVESKCRAYYLYKRKGLNLVPNRTFAFALQFVMSIDITRVVIANSMWPFSA